jgi:hypothetical protein
MASGGKFSTGNVLGVLARILNARLANGRSRPGRPDRRDVALPTRKNPSALPQNQGCRAPKIRGPKPCLERHPVRPSHLPTRSTPSSATRLITYLRLRQSVIACHCHAYRFESIIIVRFAKRQRYLFATFVRCHSSTLQPSHSRCIVACRAVWASAASRRA